MNFLRAISYQWFATGYVSAISMVQVFVLGRILGPVQFGKYSYIISIVSIYYILQEGGFRTLLFREGTNTSEHFVNEKEKLLKLALGHVLTVSLFGLFLVIIIPMPFRWGTGAAIICYGFLAVSGFCSASLKSKGLFEKEAIWQIIVRTFSFVFVITTLIFGFKEMGAIFLIWGAGIAFALTLPIGRNILRKPEIKFDKKIYYASGAMLMINAATVIYFRCDMILLEYLGGGSKVVGEYAAAYRMMEGVILVMTPVAHIGFRQLRLNWKNKENFNRIFLNLSGIMLFFGITIYLIGNMFGGNIVSIVFGREYHQANSLLIYLLMALIFVLPNYIITQAMIALNKEKIYAYTTIAAAALNILGNLYMIPTFGARGAAIVTVATEFFLFSVLGYVYWKWLSKPDLTVTA